MVLFRFLFAPVLLAVAVLSASDRHAQPPPSAAAAPHETAPAPARDARASAPRAAPTRPATGP